MSVVELLFNHVFSTPQLIYRGQSHGPNSDPLVEQTTVFCPLFLHVNPSQYYQQ